MAHRDPYDVLGVSRDADQDDIKSAYRRLALRYHPDKNPDDERAEEAFREVSWAYEILSDPVRRRRFDRGGMQAAEGPRPGEFSMRRGVQAFAEVLQTFGEFFTEDGRGEGPAPIEGEDLYATLDLSLEEAMTGASRRISAPAVRVCPACRGNGAAAGAEVEPCPDCEGRGQYRPGLFSMRERCETCHGSGDVASRACERCGGRGRVRQRREVTIEVPAGVADGQTLRRAGQGAPGRFGGESGDLRIEVRLKPHHAFERRGADVYTEASIPSTTASLGGEARVPTLESDVRMTIPAGTTSGDVFRLEGRGFPAVRGHGRGDQYVEVAVETPVDLTDRQRERVRQRDEADASGGESGVGESIRELFTP